MEEESNNEDKAVLTFPTRKKLHHGFPLSVPQLRQSYSVNLQILTVLRGLNNFECKRM